MFYVSKVKLYLRTITWKVDCGWKDFLELLLERFQPMQEGALHDQLFSLQYATTV